MANAGELIVGDETNLSSPVPTASGPVIIDLGKRKRSLVRKLRRGRGKLVDRVNEVLAELTSNGSVSTGSQPVIVVVERKKKRMGGGLRLF